MEVFVGAILSRPFAARTFADVRPALDAAIESGLVTRRDMAIVVTATRDINPWPDTPQGFRETCYLVAEIGDLSRSAFPNREIALKKAELSARTGRPTASLPPQYLGQGDTVFWGSAVLDGIVVACAGLEERHDEMLSWWIAAAMQAAAREEFRRRVAEQPNESFLG
jgi:hypothetical protein